MEYRTRLLGFETITLIASLCLSTILVEGSNSPKGSKAGVNYPQFPASLLLDDEIDAIEFKDFCKEQERIRRKILVAKGDEKDKCKLPHAGDFDPEFDMIMLLSLFLIISWGALVRTTLRHFKSSVPYTVVLMISGLIIGCFSKNFCEHFYIYTAIARMNPKIILFTFIPVLIFESAFSIPAHTFFRCTTQILILALPGMLFGTFATALICQQFLQEYNWTFLEAAFFGSIISATDPVAVVSILRELGVSEQLSVMIEGESLLNDGVAILLYEIFEEVLTSTESKSVGHAILDIGLQFVRIAIGGPIFGYVMGKLAIVALWMVFNDSTVEITVTLVFAYLTYYIGEDMMGVSGVMAVVMLGITMSAERTTISPDSEADVHHFWEMVGYLANTVLFVIVGIVIVETSLSSIDWIDVWYVIFLWFALNIVRLFMLLTFAPLLSRIGYGLSWQNTVVIMWGGLRGAIGICLSLQVYQHKHFCNQTNIGPKFLFQTAGVVFLTLVVNGTTTKKLLEILKLTEISPGRIEEMANATKQISSTQIRAITMLKHDRFLADASWCDVKKFTNVLDPYREHAAKLNKPMEHSSLISLNMFDDHTTMCPECAHVVQNEPSQSEYTAMTEEARVRVLKALKLSFWRQFENGVLSESAVQILATLVETAEDKTLYLVHARELETYMTIHGILPKLRRILVKRFRLDQEEPIPEEPKSKFRHGLWWIATKDWFDGIMMVIVVLNLIPIIWEFSMDVTNNTVKDDALKYSFISINFVFTVIYIMEFFVKIVGRGPRDYFKNKWNWVDLIVMNIAIFDILFSLCGLFPNCAAIRGKYFTLIKSLPLLRLGRSIRLIKPLVPLIIVMINRRINHQLFLGYETAKGYLVAIDDVLKFLPQMVENVKVAGKLKLSLLKQRETTIRAMAALQSDHPGIAIAVTTRHGSRSVLNEMREALVELKDDGLVDDKENSILTLIIEERIKRLWSSPVYILPPLLPQKSVPQESPDNNDEHPEEVKATTIEINNPK